MAFYGQQRQHGQDKRAVITDYKRRREGNQMKKWWQSKTIWTGITAIVGTAAAYFTGEIELGQASQTAVTALICIFLRSGMLEASGSGD